MKNRVIDAIKKEKLIVIVRGVKKEKMLHLTEALYKGGIRLLEFTYSADGSISDEETSEIIGMLAENFKGRMFIGAGTVLREKQVELTHKVGGSFIISPDANPSIIKKTIELGLVSIPGVMTPTEIVAAHNAGADFVKLFPVTNLGSGYVKAIKAPLSHIDVLAVGGINHLNIAEYAAAGACGFGVGGVINKELINADKFEEITQLAKKYVTAANGEII